MKGMRMFDKWVQSLLDKMTWEERLDFDTAIMSRFNGTEHAEAWRFRKLMERARENSEGECE